MDHGHGNEPHKRLEVRVEHGTVHVVSMRVGSVEDDEVDPLLRAGFHHEHQGADVRVEARPNVLNVKHHHIDALELLGLRFAVLAMQGVHLQSCGHVDAVVDFCTVGGLPSKTMFWSKHMHDAHPTRKQGVDQMLGTFCPLNHARVVAHHCHALVLEHRQVGPQARVAKLDGSGR